MSFKPLRNENSVQGIAPVYEGPQYSVSNQDSVRNPETNLAFPFIIDPSISWLAYSCWVEVELDAGMALHKPLPQTNDDVDTLATADIDQTNFDTLTAGVNTKSSGNFTDIVQRMATSTYIFKLRGSGVRVGYRVPIPGLVSVAGVAPTPAERQYARNVLVGNFNGVPVFRGEWDLWYYVASPPKREQMPPDNLALHTGGASTVAAIKKGITIPNSAPDWNAVSTLPNPRDLRGGIPAEKPIGT